MTKEIYEINISSSSNTDIKQLIKEILLEKARLCDTDTAKGNCHAKE